MMFAQSIEAIPSDFWKNFSIALIALFVIAGIAFGIWASVRKPEPTRLNDEPAIKVEKQSKRYNHEAIEQRFGRIETRIDGHDSELNAAWEEMKLLRESNGKRYTNIAIALTEIKAHMGIKSKSNLTEDEA